MSFLSKLNSKNILLGTFILLLVMLRLPSLFEPQWNRTEGFNFAIANSLQNGQLLYKDIWFDSPPLLITFYYFANLFGNLNLLIIKLLSLLSSVGTLIFTFKLARKFFTTKVAILTACISLILLGTPIADANLATSTLFSLFFITAGIYQFVRKDFKLDFLSGLLLGLALTTDISHVFEIIAVAVCALLINKKNRLKMLAFYMLGLYATIASLIYFLYLQENLDNFFQIVLIERFNTIYDMTNSSFGFLVLRNSLFSRLLILLATLGGFIYLFIKRKISKRALFLSLISIFSVFTVFYHKTLPTSNLLILVPLFSIITSIVFREAKNNISIQKFQVIALYIVTTLFFLSTYFRGYQYTKSTHLRNYYINFATYLVGKKTSQSYISSFSEKTNNMYKLDSYLVQNYENTKNIYIWTDNPWIYELSDLVPSVRYLFSKDALTHWGETKSYLVKNSPKLIVVDKDTNGTKEIIDFTLENNYHFEEEIDSFTLYQKATEISQV